MNITMLTFILNDHEKFIINIDNAEDIIDCCYQSQVTLYINDKKRSIGKSIITDFAQELKRKLTLTLSNELILHPSIEKNIGYYWNQKLNEDSSNLFLIQGKEESYWVGSTYLLWTTDSRKKNQRYATWLYNDTQGNIIFEVTPTYPDTFIDPEDPADLKAYQEWMEKKYKPFFTRTIPRDVGIQWLDQANLILQTISDNVKMLEEKYKNENEE